MSYGGNRNDFNLHRNCKSSKVDYENSSDGPIVGITMHNGALLYFQQLLTKVSCFPESEPAKLYKGGQNNKEYTW